MSIENFFTWEVLATIAGATAATALLVELVKPLIDKLIHIPTQILSYLIALVILLASYFFTNQLTLSSGVLLCINAVIVSLASNGGFDFVKRLCNNTQKTNKG